MIDGPHVYDEIVHRVGPRVRSNNEDNGRSVEVKSMACLLSDRHQRKETAMSVVQSSRRLQQMRNSKRSKLESQGRSAQERHGCLYS